MRIPPWFKFEYNHIDGLVLTPLLTQWSHCSLALRHWYMGLTYTSYSIRIVLYCAACGQDEVWHYNGLRAFIRPTGKPNYTAECLFMMTSYHGNCFPITGPSWVESIGDRQFISVASGLQHKITGSLKSTRLPGEMRSLNVILTSSYWRFPAGKQSMIIFLLNWFQITMLFDIVMMDVINDGQQWFTKWLSAEQM